MKEVTFAECCRELMRRGYETLYIREIGLHRTIAEWLKDSSDEPEGKPGYTIFGNVIVRIAHNWRDDAEIYIAEQ